ncbi:acyl-CoA N-acyltransferase [Polychytrium aggregatum]|uniref:acyl-CoA N-acyltransferase n=1 Tax=Polychytrium aggregatum TaxID=110093 RepID=UPI0022FE5B94|nr:acyl-CoA N-acyltransferase [Polychytrium aggregatum]KAI9207675.1 acyl-CoA N-acyltransferase [Polychytrium aggregatum]
MHIRQATLADAEILSRIAISTFTETWERYYNPQEFQKLLVESFDLPLMQAALASPSTEVYFLLEGDEILGYALLRNSREPGIDGPDPIMELQRLYLAKSAHGGGRGQYFLTWLLETLKSRGIRTVWLGVWQGNVRAKGLYEKNGFRDTGNTHLFSNYKLGDYDDIDQLYQLVFDETTA